jgi:hypothetical protein
MRATFKYITNTKALKKMYKNNCEQNLKVFYICKYKSIQLAKNMVTIILDD